MSRILAATLALLPTIAAAQGFEGSVVDLQYQKSDDGAGQRVDSIEGTLDASWQFGRMGFQGGLVLGKDIDNSNDISLTFYSGLTLHLTADMSDNLRIGAMIAADNQADGVYLYAAEALYLAGPVRVEGRLGDNFGRGDPFTLFEVDGAYEFGGAFSARAGLHYSDFGTDGHNRIFSLGAGYRLASGTQLYADYSRKNTGDTGGSLVNLGVRFDLGGGGSEKTFTYQPLN